jgi:hypothetical protein
MRQKNGFDRYPEFKSKGIGFEVGDKYLFWQLTDLLIRQSCQACSSKPLAIYYYENKSKDRVEDLKIRRSRRIDQVEDLKIRDSTRICNSGRISGATDRETYNVSRPNFRRIFFPTRRGGRLSRGLAGIMLSSSSPEEKWVSPRSSKSSMMLVSTTYFFFANAHDGEGATEVNSSRTSVKSRPGYSPSSGWGE